MLNELITFTHSYEFEEYGTLDLVGVRKATDVLTLSLEVSVRSETNLNQLWEVDCVGVLEHRISIGGFDDIGLSYDHPLLWSYIYPEASISFYGGVEDHRSVVGALYKQHFKLVGDWIPFRHFMNGNPIEMLRGRYGMLAEGPTPLMQAYARVLESFKIDCGITEPKPAYYTNDEFSGLAEVGVLILDKDCYFVAPSFNERCISAQTPLQ